MRLLFLVALSIFLTGCATSTRLAAPPESAQYQLTNMPDKAGLRNWGDEPIKGLASRLKIVNAQRAAHRGTRYSRAGQVLVISGGGASGAFGAGLLDGWSRSGRRPKFDVVTGVSTGAIMAPFAFLGPRYDPLLKEFYTSYSTDDILSPTILAGVLGGMSVTSSVPLENLIRHYFTRDIMRAIAREHAKGRRLMIGTTNLDSERPVIWNIGEIASVGTDAALKLIQKVILASTAIPGVFPPVMIDVNKDGQSYQEMHVDGGTTDNVVLLPFTTNLRAIYNQNARIYVLANTHLNPQWKNVEASTAKIATRSVNTLIKQQTLGDLLKIYDFAKFNRFDFNLASVPADFDMPASEPFDKVQMQALFKLGKKLGRRGYKWAKRPPLY